MSFPVVIACAWMSLMSLLVPSDGATIVFAGDAMQHQRQVEAARQPDGSYSYDTYFTDIQPYISSADFAVVNLETPLGGPPYKGYPMFSAHDNYLSSIKDAGFDLVLTANNHILDCRDKGVRRTIATLESKDMHYVGVYRNAAHRDSVLPMIQDINGFKVAFLNYTYGTNGIKKTSDIEIDYIDRARMAADVKKARQNGAEIVAVCIHWGDEYHLLPNSHQKELAKFLDSLGVELIIGGHPHVIQPMELKRSNTTGRPYLTVYSLGNFISNMATNDTRGGAMVRVHLGRDIFGKAYVDKADYRLVFTELPVGRGDNFKIKQAEKHVLPATLDSKRKIFIKNAEGIFNRHNINVERDTTEILPGFKHFP